MTPPLEATNVFDSESETFPSITTMILFCLGVIGLYIGKIYEQTKERPRYIIEEKCGN